MRLASQAPNPPRPPRVIANGHDVTDKMPLTQAELARQQQQPNPPRPPAEPEYKYAQTSENPLDVGGPMPQSMGRCADFYNDVRTLRLAMEKEMEAVKAREHQIREHIIANLSKSDDSGASGLKYRAQIVMKDVPRATDWAKVHEYIQKTGRFDLLQKRLGEKAVADTWESGVQIPGVECVHVPDVSITKIPGR